MHRLVRERAAIAIPFGNDGVRPQIFAGEKVAKDLAQAFARCFFVPRVGPVEPTLLDKTNPFAIVGTFDCGVRQALPERPVSTIENDKPAGRIAPISIRKFCAHRFNVSSAWAAWLGRDGSSKQPARAACDGGFIFCPV